ncbi:uncharacterized protein N7487_012223 [Penicillium crustosum]|uniref:uncharacterized protein n=1 Tax=Penicillium crustosum TaxID=36656 RepID=UPI0023A2B386|nr:uncharacterized protein N7487_012223 [Penicillium crustosum]KAJ5394582.1 hypothetical protein N7487_012223 [Penicillium crustosum]
MIISQFRTSPSSFPLHPFSFLWQVSKVLCLSLFDLFIATSTIDIRLKILDSVSSVLDSWLVLVSTIPKPPNILIFATSSCPAYLKVAHPVAIQLLGPDP